MSDGGSAILCYIKIRNIFRFSKSAQFQRCFLGRKQSYNYIILRVLQENADIGHPGRKHRRIIMAIPCASMPPHSSHAQMVARFFGCALIIVPLIRGYMSFRPRMDFDGQNHVGRPSRQSYVKIPSEWRWCVWVLRYGHMKMPSRFLISLISCRNWAWRCHEVLGHIRQPMSRSKKDHQYNSNEGKLKKVQRAVKKTQDFHFPTPLKLKKCAYNPPKAGQKS